jgi:hypothetical protein
MHVRTDDPSGSFRFLLGFTAAHEQEGEPGGDEGQGANHEPALR